MRKITFLLVVFISFLLTCKSQNLEEIFIRSNGKLVKTKEEATKFIQIKNKKSKSIIREYRLTEKNKWKENSYYKEIFQENDSTYAQNIILNDKIVQTFKRICKKMNDSLYTYKEFNQYGDIIRKGYTYSCKVIIPEGIEYTFYMNGAKMSKSFYHKNELIGNNNWEKNGDISYANVYDDVDVQPIYNGITHDYMKDIYKNIKYPEKSLNVGFEDIIIVSFIIMEDGCMQDVKILQGYNFEMTKEVLRVINSLPGKWTPGILNNKNVRVQKQISINLKIPE